MNVISGVIILYVTYYTILYGKLVWDEGNKPGAIAIFILALSVFGFPILHLFID